MRHLDCICSLKRFEVKVYSKMEFIKFYIYIVGNLFLFGLTYIINIDIGGERERERDI